MAKAYFETIESSGNDNYVRFGLADAEFYANGEPHGDEHNDMPVAERYLLSEALLRELGGAGLRAELE